MASLLDIPIELFDIIVSYLEPREQRLFCRTSHEVCNRLTRPYSTTTIQYNPFQQGDSTQQLCFKQTANKPGCLKSTIVVQCSDHQQNTRSVQQGNRHEGTETYYSLDVNLLLNTLKDLLARHHTVRAPVGIVLRVDLPANDVQARAEDQERPLRRSASMTALKFMDLFFREKLVVHEINLFYDQQCSSSLTALDSVPFITDFSGREPHLWQLRTLCLNFSDRVRQTGDAQLDQLFSTDYNGLINLLKRCSFLTTLKLRFCNRPTPFQEDQTHLTRKLAHSRRLGRLKQLELKNLRCDSDELSYIVSKNIRDLSLISVTLPQRAWKNILRKIHRRNYINLRLENLATPKWIYFPGGSELNPWGKMTRTLVRRDWQDCDKPVDFHVSEKKVGLETYDKRLYRAEYGAP
ncbi:hypothetical protein MRB53_038967 [Persea americana]|nr:hypothetical protein MRB53_038967 [Persea americana]